MSHSSHAAHSAAPRFGAEFKESISTRAVFLVLTVLLLQLGFIASYVGALHKPTPHRVLAALVTTASAVSTRALALQLDALPGKPVDATISSTIFFTRTSMT